MSNSRRGTPNPSFPGPEDIDIVNDDPNGNGGAVHSGADVTPLQATKVVDVPGQTARTRSNGKDRSRSAFAAVRARIKDGKRPWGRPEDALWQSHPTLAEWLMLRTLDGIRIREVATLSLSATPTGFAATLSDYYLGLKLPVKADSLLGLLDALERELNNQNAAWIELDKGRGADRRKELERKALDERGIKREDVLPEGEEEKNR